MEKVHRSNFLNLNFLYLYIIFIFKEFIEYNSKPDIDFKIETIKIYKIN